MRNTTSNTKSLLRNGGIILLKIILATGLVYLLLSTNRLTLKSIIGALAQGRGLYLLLAGVAIILLGQLVLAWRLMLPLKTLKHQMLYSRVLGLTFIGSLSGAALPGMVGGDIVKALYLFGNSAGQRNKMLAALMVDRILGIYSLLLLGAIASGLTWVLVDSGIDGWVLLLAPVIVLATTAFILLISKDSYPRIPLISAPLSWIPDTLRTILLALREYLQNPGLLTMMVALSLVNHILCITGFWIAAIVLHDTLPARGHFIAAPLALTMNAIPLTPGGLGITEGAFSFLYEILGSPNGGNIGLLGRCIEYTAYILGGTISLITLRAR